MIEELTEEEGKQAMFDQMQKEKAELDLPGRAKYKRESPIWKGLLRSKGFVWLATRPHVHGEWSQAGVCFIYCPGFVFSYYRDKMLIFHPIDHVYLERRWPLDVPCPRKRVAWRR